jgi:tetratricopeptide (TPR) repeat protein
LSLLIGISVILFGQLDAGPSPTITKSDMATLSQISTPTLTTVEILSFESPDSALGSVFRGEIQERLSRHADLSVVTSMSSPQLIPLSDVGQEARVNHNIEGRIAFRDDAYALSLALSTTTGQNIWSDEFLFGADIESQKGLQRRVSRHLAEALGSTAKVAEYCEPSNVLQALENYHEARLLINRKGPDNLNRAVVLLKDAIDLDPDYGRAYSALAITYLLQRRMGARDLVVDLSRQALNKCPTLGAAYKIWVPPYEGITDVLVDQELQFRDALAMEPNHLWLLDNYASFLADLGMNQEAFSISERFYRNNPNDPRAVVAHGWNVAFMTGNTEGRRYALKAKELGDQSCNADMLRLLIEFRESVSVAAIRDAYDAVPQRCRDAMLQGFDELGAENVYGASTDLAKRRVVLEFLEDTIDVDPNRTMVWAIELGNPELAFRGLEKARAEHRYVHWQAFWTRSDNARLFRRDPRFVQFLSDENVDHYWREFGWPAEGMCTPFRDTFVCDN